ncbi:flagellar basal body-associated FliL family protein [Epibacterium ulvae]|uniref:flagellar basal body-associated FliL family protein n=1 Tax=Epibacterium ulvae TaxID=1156985 RepID=UPI001BFCAB55|nr:flagellar basal body-associated FliL family protein [Epibacterium ulvae]MBT8155142.1 flagellar basal body-associated FliL family protein [Epibacterium ulvae]
MIAKLLPVILLVVGTAGGIGAGIMMKPAPEEHAEMDENSKEAMHKEEEMEKEAKEMAKMDPEAEPKYEYIKIQNQFVVPVVEHEELASLVVVSLSLETDIGMNEMVHAYEPKLRDVFLQVLFDHANMGGFQGAFTRSDVLATLRTALREAAQRQLGAGINDVLIVEISRQDV